MEQNDLETTTAALIAPSQRAAHCASLSVIVLSNGDRSLLERALASMASRCRRLEAEVIVVRAAMAEEFLIVNAAYPSITFVEAPVASTVVQMRELGMSFAAGDIVSFRNDGDVGDGSWLAAFDAMVGLVDEPTSVETEIARIPVSDDPIAERERERRQGVPFSRVGAVSSRHELRADAAYVSPLLDREAGVPVSLRSES